MTKTIDMMRDYDINHTKPKYSEIKCKMIMPEYMLDRDYHDEAKSEEEDDQP
jgi:hypothetical protein